MTKTATGITEVPDEERPAPVSLMAFVYRALDEENARIRPPVDTHKLVTMFEGSGRIQFSWEAVEEAKKDLKREPPLIIRKSHIKFIARHLNEPWVRRAVTRAFWQCFACGFDPRPAFKKRFGAALLDGDGRQLLDDTIWEWWSDRYTLDWEECDELVALTQEANRIEKEVKQKKPFNIGVRGIARIW